MDGIIEIVLIIIAIFIAVTIHEFSKAAISTVLGDKLPKNEGRLSINPFKHFEPIGFVLLFAFNFGWGKPVRTSPLFYKNRKRDTVISYAVPIIISLIAGFIFHFALEYTVEVFSSTENIILVYIAKLLIHIRDYCIILAVCNIIPISPFCGERILSSILPIDKSMRFIQMQNILQMVMLLALFFGIVQPVIIGIVKFIIHFYSCISIF